MSTSVATPSPAKNRFFLIIIIALFVAPLLAAWLLVGRWQPGATSNHGELLDPAKPVHHLSLRTLDGDTVDASYLRGRWTLLYVGPDEACSEPCRRGLYNIRQVRLALGKDADRAQTLMALPAPPDAELSEWLNREHATTVWGIADLTTMRFFDQAFDAASTQGSVYLIDPLGNLVMRYGSGASPKGMLEDLEHLLKLSKIG